MIPPERVSEGPVLSLADAAGYEINEPCYPENPPNDCTGTARWRQWEELRVVVRRAIFRLRAGANEKEYQRGSGAVDRRRPLADN